MAERIFFFQNSDTQPAQKKPGEECNVLSSSSQCLVRREKKKKLLGGWRLPRLGTSRLDTGRDVVVGLGEEVGLVSCSLDRYEGLDEEGLDLPGSVGESSAGVGIEERRSGLLEQVREGVGAVVVPLRGLQQRQIDLQKFMENVYHWILKKNVYFKSSFQVIKSSICKNINFKSLHLK